MSDQEHSTAGTGTGTGTGSGTGSSKASGGTSGSKGSKGSGSSQRTPGQAVAGEYICVFWLGGKPYALDVVYVAEVVATAALTPVPLTPSTVLGMQNLRGTALAIVDLARILGLPAQEHHRGDQALMVLVLRLQGRLVGVRIDRVQAVYEFEKDKLKPSAAQSEHPAVQGLLELSTRGGLVATLLNGDEIARRIESLRFKEAERTVAVE